MDPYGLGSDVCPIERLSPLKRGRIRSFSGVFLYIFVLDPDKKIFMFFSDIPFGCGPLTVTVTTRIIIFLVGDPYKPSFPTVTVRGPHPIYHCIYGLLIGL